MERRMAVINRLWEIKEYKMLNAIFERKTTDYPRSLITVREHWENLSSNVLSSQTKEKRKLKKQR